MQLTGAEIVIECLKRTGGGYGLWVPGRYHSEYI